MASGMQQVKSAAHSVISLSYGLVDTVLVVVQNSEPNQEKNKQKSNTTKS